MPTAWSPRWCPASTVWTRRRCGGWRISSREEGRGHVCLTHWRRPGEALRLHATARAAERYGLTPLATGDVLYHHPDRRMLQDVVTAIREKCTIDELGFRRERHAGRHLMPPNEMARLFGDHSDALAAVEAVAERCTFSPGVSCSTNIPTRK
ncbi:hypothetical protein AB5I41_19830 [Sphingomonas sp. MMS24-JH45]